MNDKIDRRSQRTRTLLGDALVKLIREKDYRTITVSDIVKRANVGRSTFYAHYETKDSLLEDQLERVIQVLSQRIPSQAELPFFPSLGLFRHVGEEYELYKSLVWTPGINALMKHMQSSLSQRVEEGLAKSGRQYDFPPPILANFLVGSFLTLLQWWLESKRIQSPEQMDAIFKKLTLTGIEAAKIE
jgi:AcrR family transcriptional regulator